MSGTSPLDLEEIFLHGGGLSEIIPNFEHRPQQLQLASAFQSVIEEGGVLLAEVGTGAGKTMAYLVPAINSGRRTIISTGTRNLQEQVFQKDIPLLGRLWPGIRSAYLKGRANYLCLERLAEALNRPFLPGSREEAFFTPLEEWSGKTATGDRAELAWLADDEPLWSTVSAESEACSGSRCPRLARCFMTRARRKAQSADLVVVNHHLLLAEAVMAEAGLKFLPEADILILDEAHLLEEVATRHLGLEVSSAHLARLLGESSTYLTGEGKKSDRSLVRRGFETLDRLLKTDTEEPSSFQLGSERGLRVLEAMGEMEPRMAEMGERLRELGLGLLEVEFLSRRAGRTAEELAFIRRMEDPEFIYWGERRERLVSVNASPVDVSGMLPDLLFDRFGTVLLTSATLTMGGDFGYIKRRLGLDQPRELIADSPFDYERQAVLFIPEDMPHPNQPRYPLEAARRIVPLLRLTRGRAFVLCTSRRSLEMIYDLLKKEEGFTVLKQGAAPRTRLLEDFKRLEGAVLVATISFWQGVDVPGADLTGVIIDRLPFASPDDPVTEGRISHLRDRGRNPFIEYQLPSAVIMLRQGLGRLIRRRTDRGLLAIMDSRILHQRYGKVFLKSLPPMRIITDEKELEKVYSELDPGGC